MAELRIGIALLAAGSSKRFGDADKLAQKFRGARLGEHAARAIPRQQFEQAHVITAEAAHPCAPAWTASGFETVLNPDAAQGMGTSVALAACLATEAKLDALIIALADMPLVPREHFAALIAELKRTCDIVGSASGGAHMPPAIFGSEFFAELAVFSGDQGARMLINESRAIRCPPEWLIDIDTPDMLRKYGQAGAPASTAPTKGDTP